MQEKLQNFAQLSAHRVTDSCIVALLSHGVEGGVYGVDGKVLQVRTVLWMVLDHVCHLRPELAAAVCVRFRGSYVSTYPPFSLLPFHQLQEVFRLFDNANCPSLQNKPKMFFIQACRGGECPAGRAPGWRLLGSLPPALTFLFAPLRCYWIPWAPPSVHCCHRLSCSVSVPDAWGVLGPGQPMALRSVSSLHRHACSQDSFLRTRTFFFCAYQ